MVSDIFYSHPYLGKVPILTNFFSGGLNHQPVINGNPDPKMAETFRLRAIAVMACGLGNVAWKIHTGWVPDPVMNGVITLINGFKEWVIQFITLGIGIIIPFKN